MGAWNDIKTWFTGRNGVYEDEAKVTQAIDDLNAISSASGPIADTKEDVNNAIDKLNQCTGVEEFLGHVNSNAFDSVFDQGVSAAVDELIKQIKAKQEGIKEYNESSVGDKFLGTLSMTTGKLGEGFFSVFEGIGDAAIVPVAWVCKGVDAIAKTNSSKHVQDFIDTDFSQKIMSPLTTNSLATRASMFTADSGAASIVKGIGKTTGYLTLAGYVSGAAGAAKTLGSTSKAASILANTTNANTAVAAISGFGQGTQTGLQSGKGLGMATLQGGIQGTVEGATAYVAGKIGEKSQIKAKTKEADELVSGGGATRSEADAWLKDEVANIKATGGYDDQITNAARSKGENDYLNIANAVENKTGVKRVLAGAKQAFIGNPKESLSNVGSKLADNFNEPSIIANHKNVKQGLTGDAMKTGTKLGKATSGFIRTAKDVGKVTFVTPIKGALTSTAGGLSAAGATRLGTEMALGGVSNAVDYNTGLGINSDKAYEQFRVTKQTKDDLNKEYKRRQSQDSQQSNQDTSTTDNNQPTNDTPTDNNQPTDDKSNSGNNSNHDNSSNGGGSNRGGSNKGESNRGGSSTGGGSNTGGSSTGGTSGGGGTTDGTSQTQFRQTDSTSKTDDTQNKTPSSTTTDTSKADDKLKSTTDKTDSNTNNQSNTTNGTQTPTNPTNTAGNEFSNNSTNGGGQNQQPTVHTGGGYSASTGYSGSSSTGGGIPGVTAGDTSGASTGTGVGTDAATDISSITDTINDDGTTSIEDVIKGGKYTKIPTSSKPVTTTTTSSGSSAVIPIAAGLSAAAAAGIGAKAYMDRKNNNDNGEDDEEINTDEWTGDDSVDIQYDDASDTGSQDNVLDADDDYSYQPAEETEKYDARSSDELADLQ